MPKPHRTVCMEIRCTQPICTNSTCRCRKHHKAFRRRRYAAKMFGAVPEDSYRKLVGLAVRQGYITAEGVNTGKYKREQKGV